MRRQAKIVDNDEVKRSKTTEKGSEGKIGSDDDHAPATADR